MTSFLMTSMAIAAPWLAFSPAQPQGLFRPVPSAAERGVHALFALTALPQQAGRTPVRASLQESARDPAAGAAVSGARLVEARTEPDQPGFGEVFQVRVTVRLPRRSGVFVQDTLGNTNSLRSAGRGRLEESSAPGDSVEVRGIFPVLAFRDGTRELPSLLIQTGGELSAPGAPNPLERIPLGSVEVRPLPGFGPEGGATRPRPPADVLGRSWSVWLVLAGVSVVLGLVGLTMFVVRRRPAAPTPVEPVRQASGPLSRAEALRRLDEIRAEGWHRNGRVSDFYRASTDTLRRFLEGTDPGWTASLTSRELVGLARARWGDGRTRTLEPAVEVAERVKFGGLRPEASRAEDDWAAIRGWIEESPRGVAMDASPADADEPRVGGREEPEP